ncbi:MAG: M6 family metalloprotease domain-containing protein [Bacteroidaceae bacterium]|nr:M6 family metalloprotease domain-containing protein [Bacteroidaceae bacterium]
MKRLLSFFLLALFVATTAWAVRPLKRFFVKTQSDGTQIVVARMGDGHHGVVFYVTQDDLVLVQNADGDLCYATPEGNRLRASSFLAHEPHHRTAAEQTFLQTSSLSPSRASQVVSNRVRRAPVNRISGGSSSRSDGLGTYGVTAGGAVPSIGEFTMPVIMVEFSDVKFQSTTTQAVLSKQYNTEGYTDDFGSVGSARDYFISQSSGMFRPRFDVAAKVTLSRTRAYYGKDKSDDEIDTNLEKFRSEALDSAVAAGVDFSKYVYQGGVPCVILLYAGQGEANSFEDEASNYLWPCEWDEDADFRLGGKTVHINSFFVGNEIQYDYTASYNSRTGEYTYSRVGDPQLEGIGTFCHEFGHALGLPDFYCTDYSHELMPLGYWDIMDMGSYLNGGYAPVGHTAYEKNFLGWLKIRELTEAETVTLRPFGTEEGDHAVLVRNDKDPKEYYIFENRQAGTWYPEEMAGGMFAVHVAYNYSLWVQNELNNTASKLRMHVLAADGAVESPYQDSDLNFQSDLFPGTKKVTKILNSGTPGMKAYTGTYMNKPLYAIALDGENVTFNFLEEEISTLPIGAVFTEGGLCYEVVKAGEVYVTVGAEAAYAGEVVIPATVFHDNATWKVVGIRSGAFTGCDALTALTIGAKVADIESGWARHTPALASISVEEGNGNFEAVGGALYSKKVGGQSDEGEQVLFDFANNTLGLPVSTQSDQSAGIFSGPAVYQGVTLSATNGSTPTRMWSSTSGMSLRIYNGGTLTLSVPDGATISKVVFTTTSSAWNITTASTGTLSSKTWTGSAGSVTFSNTGGGTFLGSISVTAEGMAAATPWTLFKVPAAVGGTFDVPDEVSVIADFALEDAGYTSVTLPATLTRLGEGALSLGTLSVLVANSSTPAACTADPFEAVDQQTCLLYVPDGATDYATADYWRDFTQRRTITTALTPVWASPAARSSGWYDLYGRRVHVPQRGIYISGDGQKVIH